MYTENMSIIVVLFDIEKEYLTNRISVIKNRNFSDTPLCILILKELLMNQYFLNCPITPKYLWLDPLPDGNKMPSTKMQ